MVSRKVLLIGAAGLGAAALAGRVSLPGGGSLTDTERCEVEVQEAQNFAAGKGCAQQVLPLLCPASGMEYVAKNSCEIQYLLDKGWLEAGGAPGGAFRHV